jgi:hypothetical protein
MLKLSIIGAKSNRGISMRFRAQLGLLATFCIFLSAFASVRANTILSENNDASNIQPQPQQSQISNPTANQPMNSPPAQPAQNNNSYDGANPSTGFQSTPPSSFQQSNPSNSPSVSQQPSSSSATALNDSEITTQIQAMIMGNSSLLGANIRVITNDGNVTLEGTAASSKQADDAIKAAQSVYGVKSVTSNIQLQAN